jgi:cell division protein FtsB
MSTAPHRTAHPQQSCWVTSLAFWLCLFTSAVLYGTVSLAPKLVAYFNLNRDYQANRWKLFSVEKQVDRLAKVIEAQTNDPAFLREQARSAFDVAAPDEQRIPVDSHLRLNIETGGTELPAPPRSIAWYAPILGLVASSRVLGDAMLGMAAVLVLYAFGRLYDRTQHE